MSQKKRQDKPNALLKKAVEYHVKGNIDQAESFYIKALATTPSDSDAHHNFGMLLYQRRHNDQALEHIFKAIEINPAKGQFWMSAAQVLRAMGQSQQILELITLAESNGVDQVTLNWLQQYSNETDGPTAAEINEALVLFNAAKIEEAEPHILELTHRYPNHSIGWRLLGALQAHIGLYNQAKHSLEKAIKLSPKEADTYNNLGSVLSNMGHNSEAVNRYREAITLKPDFFEAYSNLGNILKVFGQYEDALQSYQAAIQINPEYADGWYNMAVLLQEKLIQLEVAERCYLKAIEIRPGFAQAHYNLGAVYRDLKKLTLSIQSYRQAVVISPADADVHYNMGNVLKENHQLLEAIASYEEAIRLRPDFSLAYENMAICREQLGDFDAAYSAYRQALEINPNRSETYNNFALLLYEARYYSDAIINYQRAIDINPNYAAAWSNLGGVYSEEGNSLRALECYKHALMLQPDLPEIHHNLSNVYRDQCEFDTAIKASQRALDLKPDFEDAYNNLLFCANYHPDISGEEIYGYYEAYEKRYGKPLRMEWRAHDNDRTPDRRLKIGYVSPAFHKHSVRHFLEPLLAHHDDTHVETYAYAEMSVDDDITKRYQGYVNHWVNTRGMSDAQLADRIRQDRIDILIDIAGHTAHNRLLVFARKPAPVSLHWLDFGYTTGLKAIDYYLTDTPTVPEGSEHLFSETPWRLPVPSIVYRPDADMGDITPLPAEQNGYITFGTLTRSVRINDRVIRVWSEILKLIPTAKLNINSSNFKDPAMQTWMQERFMQQGIDATRLIIGFQSPAWKILQQTDITLDCFPHNSGTTLLESLYMGVPFITLAGRPSVGTLGTSVLHGIGHAEWSANSEEAYIQKAVQLAQNLSLLAQYRANLRTEMQNSPLMDEVGFTRAVEQAYQQMWLKWCHSDLFVKNVSFAERGLFQNENDEEELFQKTLEQLKKLHGNGQVTEAEALARTLTQTYPNRPLVWQTLANILAIKGAYAEAEEKNQRAIQLQPTNPILHYDKGRILQEQHKWMLAINSYQQAINLQPDYPRALNNLGICLKECRDKKNAILAFEQAVSLNSDYAEAWNNLGVAMADEGDLQKAFSCHIQATRTQPESAQMLTNLAGVQHRLGMFRDALENYQYLASLNPNDPNIQNSLGTVLSDITRYDEAITCFRRALELRPDFADPWNNIGNIELKSENINEAIKSFLKALQIDSAHVLALNNLGNVYKDQCKFDDAIVSSQRALDLKPDFEDAYNNLLFCANYHPDISGEEIYGYYEAYEKRYGELLRVEWRAHDNDRTPDRRLKIGYVSPAFHKHSVRHFLEPLLAHHDSTHVETYAYAEMSVDDDITKRYQGYVNHWVNTRGMSDAQLADRIRQDRIDILIDIAGHTAHNRLLVFARKPAPVSLHWLDFGYTTGLKAIDYYLTDAPTVPEGSEHLFSEAPWRLPVPSIVYRPDADMGDITPLPAEQNGYITFGTLTRSVRINDRVIRVWSEILKLIPTAKLNINSSNFKDPAMQTWMQERFMQQGIDATRLIIGFQSPAWKILQQTDITLDCFPHNSGTTLLESLYMGVPFITLAGRPSVGTLGTSVLHGIGHAEWSANSEEAYIQKAVQLAQNLSLLAQYRANLRTEMQNSPLMDEVGFTRAVEQAYQQMWNKWCKNN